MVRKRIIMLNFYAIFFKNYSIIISKKMISRDFKIKKSKEESIRKLIKILSKSFPRIIFQNTKMKNKLIKDHEDHFVESI